MLTCYAARYKNKLEEIKRFRHAEVVSTTKNQEKEQEADEFNRKMKSLQQKIYTAKVKDHHLLIYWLIQLQTPAHYAYNVLEEQLKRCRLSKARI